VSEQVSENALFPSNEKSYIRTKKSKLEELKEENNRKVRSKNDAVALLSDLSTCLTGDYTNFSQQSYPFQRGTQSPHQETVTAHGVMHYSYQWFIRTCRSADLIYHL